MFKIHFKLRRLCQMNIQSIHSVNEHMNSVSLLAKFDEVFLNYNIHQYHPTTERGTGAIAQCNYVWCIFPDQITVGTR